MHAGGILAKKTKLQNSSCLEPGKSNRSGFRHFLVCANILKSSSESLKCVSCNLESGALMNSEMKPNSKGLECLKDS